MELFLFQKKVWHFLGIFKSAPRTRFPETLV